VVVLLYEYVNRVRLAIEITIKMSVFYLLIHNAWNLKVMALKMSVLIECNKCDCVEKEECGKLLIQ
jgi:hypothetical protein